MQTKSVAGAKILRKKKNTDKQEGLPGSTRKKSWKKEACQRRKSRERKEMTPAQNLTVNPGGGRVKGACVGAEKNY